MFYHRSDRIDRRLFLMKTQAERAVDGQSAAISGVTIRSLYNKGSDDMFDPILLNHYLPHMMLCTFFFLMFAGYLGEYLGGGGIIAVLIVYAIVMSTYISQVLA